MFEAIFYDNNGNKYNNELILQTYLLFTNEQRQKASAAMYFMGVVLETLDRLNGGANVNEAFRARGYKAIDNKTFIISALPLFIEEIHRHPFFDVSKCFNETDPNSQCFKKFSVLLQKNSDDPSLEYDIIDVLNLFRIPDISKIEITSTVSPNHILLEKNNFPEDVIPEKYCSPLSSQLMTNPAYDRRAMDTKIDKEEFLSFIRKGESNPFTRQPLNENNIAIDNSLKEKIALFLQKVCFIYSLYLTDSRAMYKEKQTELCDEELSLAAFQEVIRSEWLKKMFVRYKITPTEDEKNNLEKLMRRIAHCGEYRDLRLLLKNFTINVNSKDNNPKSLRTALHWVVIKANEKNADNLKYEECIFILIKYGADINLLDSDDKKAIAYNKLESIQNIFARVTDLPLTFFKQNKSLKKLIAKYKLPNSSQPNLEKALRNAATNNQLDDLKTLIPHVRNINACDSNPKIGRTALHWAAVKGHDDCYDLLIANGADPDILDASNSKAVKVVTRNLNNG